MNNEIEITTHVEFKSSESHDSPFAGYKDIDVVFKMPVKELLSPKIIIIAEDTTELLDDDIQETEKLITRLYGQEYLLGLYDYHNSGICSFASPITNEYYHMALSSYTREKKLHVNYFYSFVMKRSFINAIGDSKLCFYISYIDFLKYNGTFPAIASCSSKVVDLFYRHIFQNNTIYATIFVDEDALEIDYKNNEYRLYVPHPKGDIILCKATDYDISDLTSKMTFDQKMRFISMIKEKGNYDGRK